MASLIPYEEAIVNYTLEHCWFPRFTDTDFEGSLFPANSGYGSGTQLPFVYAEQYKHQNIWKNVKTLDYDVSFSGTLRTIRQVSGGKWQGIIAEYSFSESGTEDLYPNVRNSRRASESLGIGNDPFPGVMFFENAVTLRTITHLSNSDWSKAFDTVDTDVSSTPDLEVQFVIGGNAFWVPPENKYALFINLGLFPGALWGANFESRQIVGSSIGTADFLGYGDIDLYSSRGSETTSPASGNAGSWWTSGPTITMDFSINATF